MVTRHIDLIHDTSSNTGLVGVVFHDIGPNRPSLGLRWVWGLVITDYDGRALCSICFRLSAARANASIASISSSDSEGQSI